jgi:anti-sigma regulatory factor (Ser/Thr protein kinase)
MDTGRDLSIEVAARPQNVARVREQVGERARRLGADRRIVDDVRTVVSEACNNVVLHAYPKDAEDRPLEVLLHQELDVLKLVIRDRGRGIRLPGTGRPLGLRMGLLLVGAISSCFQLRSRRGGGTELALWIPLHSDSP